MATVGDTNPLKVTFIHKNGTHVITGNHTTTLADALLDLGSLVDVEPEQLKLIVKGKMYTYAKNGSLPLANFANLSIKVMGTSKNEKQDLESASARARAPATSNQNRKREPLQIFPNSDIAEAMLQRLSNDIGIRAAMRKFKLNVGLLTEMEPVTNTQVTHEGTTRLLGLNHNMGQAIELRLRTDNHRGFRDYKTVRLTLCHELAHNRVQDHNHEFWDFCHEIEREVAKSATFHTLDGRSGCWVATRLPMTARCTNMSILAAHQKMLTERAENCLHEQRRRGCEMSTLTIKKMTSLAPKGMMYRHPNDGIDGDSEYRLH
ncbi:Ubiquitin and WLM domain-containing metalloprotease [Ceratocystis lukuohia]|uniref:Ubiquitin and WLM domain-containing metalloprotease n=1 Tax=Ceratocystis lukuohia TaxID=2019550 RepID=A0ABR4MF11_9PEZI